MNYSTRYKSFLSEVFSLPQYKFLAGNFKGVAFIAVLPFIAIATICCLFYAVLDFAFRLCSSGVTYLQEWVKEMRKGTGDFATGILFLITLPFIFFCQIILSFLSLIFFILWFILQCFMYIATLGGIKWRPYINQADYDENEAFFIKTNEVAGKICVVCLAIVFTILVILFLSITFGNRLSQGVYDAYDFFRVLYFLGSCIAIPVIFKKRPLTEADLAYWHLAEDVDLGADGHYTYLAEAGDFHVWIAPHSAEGHPAQFTLKK